MIASPAFTTPLKRGISESDPAKLGKEGRGGEEEEEEEEEEERRKKKEKNNQMKKKRKMNKKKNIFYPS